MGEAGLNHWIESDWKHWIKKGKCVYLPEHRLLLWPLSCEFRGLKKKKERKRGKKARCRIVSKALQRSRYTRCRWMWPRGWYWNSGKEQRKLTTRAVSVLLPSFAVAQSFCAVLSVMMRGQLSQFVPLLNIKLFAAISAAMTRLPGLSVGLERALHAGEVSGRQWNCLVTEISSSS